MNELSASPAPANRWTIAIAGTLLQVCLGTVYAWSYLQSDLLKLFPAWSNALVAGIFSVAICFLGIAAAWGGVNLKKYGPRKLAVTGGVLFGLGYLLTAVAMSWKSWPLMYAGYGVIGGIGLGLGYVTPIATVAKWFPDRKGLVTGMVVMGFGFGAMVMSKVLLPVLLGMTSNNYPVTFAALGVLFLVVTVAMGLILRNPPAGYCPAGYNPPAQSLAESSALPIPPAKAVFSMRFAMMWLVFFCNIAAGIAIISFQSPLMQELCKRGNPSLSAPTLVLYGSWLVAISSLFNGVGRFFWGGVSDRFGRVQTFRLMLASGIVAFIMLTKVTNPWLFGGLICYILLCYGGGFGTMPSFVMDVFGPRLMPVVYGAILTAWSAAGVVGPQIIARIKDNYIKDLAHPTPFETELCSRYSFIVSACFLAAGLLAACLFLSNKPISGATQQ